MTEKTVADVADKALDKATDLVTNAADKAMDIFDASKHIIGDAIEKYGQQAIDAVLWVVRIDCAQSILSAFLLCLFVIGNFYFAYTGFKKREWDKRINSSSDGFLYIPMFFYSIFLMFVLYGNTKTVTNMWNYVCVAKPELYLVKQTVDIVKEKAQPTKK